LCIFFFQAEDGIRDGHVTGVQTCALPIWRTSSPVSTPSSPDSGSRLHPANSSPDRRSGLTASSPTASGRIRFSYQFFPARYGGRSEERRVGKECRVW